MTALALWALTGASVLGFVAVAFWPTRRAK